MELLKVSHPCKACGLDRLYTKYEIARNRHLTLCRVCAIKAYYATRPKQTDEQRKAYLKEWVAKNRLHVRAKHTAYRQARRNAILTALGGCCAHCGEADPVVLDIDHIHDDGAAHRRQTRRTNIVHLFGANIDRSRFQLLCKNCNWRKEHRRRENAKHQPKAA